jgi:hypothetical protein
MQRLLITTSIMMLSQYSNVNLHAIIALIQTLSFVHHAGETKEAIKNFIFSTKVKDYQMVSLRFIKHVLINAILVIQLTGKQ